MTTARSIQRAPSSLQQIEFVGRIGVSETQIENYSQVRGRWANVLGILRGECGRRLPEEFANWSADLDRPQEILRFTKRYAPLEASPSAGSEFQFQLSHWVTSQRIFRLYWETSGRKAAPEHWRHSPRISSPAAEEILRIQRDNPSPHSEQLHEQFARLAASWPGLELEQEYPMWFANSTGTEGDFLCRSHGRLIYGTGTLLRFLTVMLFSTPGERLRKCHNPECKAPYFVARHLNQNYCSEPCARWGQRQHTLAWWNKHGKQERQKRLKRKRAHRTRAQREKRQ